MRAEILQLAADLTRKGEGFVMAVVVRREPASSAQVGNTALITEAGTCHGWLGGSCIQSTVVREALASLFERGIDPKARFLAVAVNGAVVRRAEWPEIALLPGDSVEIVRPLQGG